MEGGTEEDIDKLKSLLCVGIHFNTPVSGTTNQRVSQIFCSGVSINYSSCPKKLWEPFAKLVLEATYEATLYTSIINNNLNTYPYSVILTKVGAGVFGNKDSWVVNAISKAIKKIQNYGFSLDIKIVHCRSIDHIYNELIY